MSGTITGSISQEITLGSASYAASITVAPGGVIHPATPGGSTIAQNGSMALYASSGVTNVQLIDLGLIDGGAGAPGSFGVINILGATLAPGIPGGTGGDGVNIQSTGAAVSVGTAGIINGGAGGSGGQVVLSTLDIATNGGNGGIGLYDVAGGINFSNAGVITGGAGGNGGGIGLLSLLAKGGNGGNGADAIDIKNGYFDNTGVVTGGAGGNGGVGLVGLLSADGAGGNGGAGLYIDGGTLINNGTISGGGGGTGSTTGQVGAAIVFGPDASTFVVGATSGVAGSIVGSGNDVLQLAGSSAVTLAGIGSTITGFSTIVFDPGASRIIAGYTAGLGSGQMIYGFTSADTIVLDNVSETSATLGSNGITLGDAAGNSDTINLAGNFGSIGSFSFVTAGNNTTISLNSGAPCFAAGTRILTARGQIAVEALVVGDCAVLAQGGTAPITWIGQRAVDLTRHARPELVRPIAIEPDAFANAVPHRRLLVSPDHALCFDGHLIPAKALLNGTSIRQIKQDTITYYHVELANHAVIYAEGVPAESYLETGNRGAFDNGGVALSLHPQFAQSQRESLACLPFAESGAVVEQVRAHCLARAAVQTTDDAAVSVQFRADGSALIISRADVPGVITRDPRDRRVLGVKIAALQADGRMISLDDPALIEGWHQVESDGRWTNGCAVIPAALVAGADAVSVVLAATLVYRADANCKAA